MCICTSEHTVSVGEERGGGGGRWVLGADGGGGVTGIDMLLWLLFNAFAAVVAIVDSLSRF